MCGLMRWLSSVFVVVLALACTETPPPASPEPESVESESVEAGPAPETPGVEEKSGEVAEGESNVTRDVPKECGAQEDLCVPPSHFSEKVCQGKFPSLALLMMEKSAPWQHRFIRDEWMEPINSHGGPSSENWLRFGEEVLLLKGSSDYDNEDLKVTGPGDVDILRADGTCATVAEKALMDRTPGISKSAPIVWKYLEEPTRAALLENQGVSKAKDAYKTACKGSSSTHPTKKCERVTNLLNQAIMRALKAGIELPLPEKRPRWEQSAAGARHAASVEAKNE